METGTLEVSMKLTHDATGDVLTSAVTTEKMEAETRGDLQNKGAAFKDMLAQGLLEIGNKVKTSVARMRAAVSGDDNG